MFPLATAFLALLVLLVALDVGLLSRRPRDVQPFEAAASISLWILGAVGVGLILALAYKNGWMGIGRSVGLPLDSHQVWLQYLTAYAVELTLSLDNIAVLALIHEHFKVPAEWRNRLLFWSVLSCLFLRAVLILCGGKLLEEFEWITWAFVVLLVGATLRLLLIPDEPSRFDRKLLVRAVRKLPVTTEPVGHHLIARVNGRYALTPLVMVVLVAVAADLTFAADSIPAAFAVTREPLVALSANALAILALRSMYFVVQPHLRRLRYIKLSLTLVLLALAAKMMRQSYGDLATVTTLAGVILVSSVAITASIITAKREAREQDRPTPLEDISDAVEQTRKNLRKVFILIGGTAVLIGAIAISPLPGPGFIVLAPIGLAILASEFLWARRLLSQLKSLRTSTERIASRTPVWWVPLVIVFYWGGMTGLAALTPQRVERFVWFASVGMFTPIGFWAFRVMQGWWRDRHPRQ